jgi:hypothetical protein
MNRKLTRSVDVSDLFELFELETRTHQLFTEFVSKFGVNRAVRAFSAEIKNAPKTAPQKRGPKGLKPDAIAKRAMLVSLAEMTKNHARPGKRVADREIARVWLRIMEANKDPTDADIRRVTAALKLATAAVGQRN